MYDGDDPYHFSISSSKSSTTFVVMTNNLKRYRVSTAENA